MNAVCRHFKLGLLSHGVGLREPIPYHPVALISFCYTHDPACSNGCGVSVVKSRIDRILLLYKSDYLDCLDDSSFKYSYMS